MSSASRPLSLRGALAYPAEPESLSDDRAKEILQAVGLGYLQAKLDTEGRWDQTLSGGERQRIAFARLLLEEPDVIVMDEATAALDVDGEMRLMTMLFERLAKATIFSVGHRPGLQELHNRLLTLQRCSSGGRIIPTRQGTIGFLQNLKNAFFRVRRPAVESQQQTERTQGKGSRARGE